MKSVCIIGAGPAGLVAAKTLVEKGGFAVTVYEAADRVGGMWRAQPGEEGDKCSPAMRTNLSRFTVAFSDLSWCSVDLIDPATEAPSSQAPPMFPTAWQVGRYLNAYAHKFNIISKINFNKKVTKAERLEISAGWAISFTDSVTNKEYTRVYDHLVVASGFFDCPMGSFDPSPLGNSDKYQHSSSFRTLTDLTHKAGKIVVIGGGISGVEAAAQAAFQISSAKHSPTAAKTTHSESTVYHVINRSFYCLPRYIPQVSAVPGSATSPAPSFLPLDLVLYNLSRRAEEVISASITTMPPEKASKGHDFLRLLIGGPHNLNGLPKLSDHEAHLGFPAYTGITDTYSEFVRSGLIVPVHGWVEAVEPDEDGGFVVTARARGTSGAACGGQSNVIAGVTGIIEATGYRTNLQFFNDEVKQLLGYDASCPRVPLLLTRGSIFAPNISNLGFVGFYEGPYWNVMEMQARLIAETWTQGEHNSPDLQAKIFRSEDAEEMRRALKTNPLQVPQFWMGDYVGLVEELSRHTHAERNDLRLGYRKGPAFPSRYANGQTGSGDSLRVIDEVADIIQASSSKARFVAAAVFRGLQGVWSIHRKIKVHTLASPGGTFLGTAHFHARVPTAPQYDGEYLYIEQGNFTMDSSVSAPVTRRYVYRYNEAADVITVWFTNQDGGSTGALFNTWTFEAPPSCHSGWLAKGYHWCAPDIYRNSCEFKFDGSALETFGITYQVKGPKKDYRHQSTYVRPDHDQRGEQKAR
ncbi:hypothetical protein BDU57DRAFT_305818 [Ampelomyces quisqualis]|uniref:Uncharacterized protein n=1 Tax=Ampelomyces quisqualis TaxID=50730 RepID=A0A6A5QJ15_AMPQU|nr:hypothetical protein BDU57DRAFT_305818 [Ampelomyces quisqualis]